MSKLHVATKSLSTISSTLMLYQKCNIKQDENAALKTQNKEVFIIQAVRYQRLLQ